MSGGRSGPFQLGTPRRFRYRLKASASIHGSESVELDESRQHRARIGRRLLSPGEAAVCRAVDETTAARPEQASQGCPPRRLHPPDCGRLRWAASRAPTRARRRIGWVGPYSLTEPPSPCPVLDRG
jgi:hypothetical protein